MNGREREVDIIGIGNIDIIGNGDSRSYCYWMDSGSQISNRRVKEARRRAFGNNDKGSKANLRKWEEKQLLEDQRYGIQLLESRRRMQLTRALKKVFVEGTATPQDIDYITRYGEQDSYYLAPKGTQVIITIVNFTPSNSKTLPKAS